MVTIDQSVAVEKPISMVYDQWTQFEEFPRFMRSVKHVQQIDDVKIHWKAQLGRKPKEWVAVIVDQVPNKTIAWRSVKGRLNSGRVEFKALEENCTRLTLQLHYEPEGVAEKLADFLGLVSGGIERDLRRFKQFIESRAVPTGRWRGMVQGGHIGQPSDPLFNL